VSKENFFSNRFKQALSWIEGELKKENAPSQKKPFNWDLKIQQLSYAGKYRFDLSQTGQAGSCFILLVSAYAWPLFYCASNEENRNHLRFANDNDQEAQNGGSLKQPTKYVSRKTSQGVNALQDLSKVVSNHLPPLFENENVCIDALPKRFLESQSVLQAYALKKMNSKR
jgi:hypothetical protein